MAKYILGRKAQNRSKVIRYCTVIGLILFFVAILQTSVFGRWKPFGVTPDLMITVVLTFTFFCGYHTGSITGIAAGFLIDALGSTGFSLLPFVYFIFAYLIGYYLKVLNAHGVISYLICFVIALAVRLFTTLAYTLLSVTDFRFSVFMLSVALPELLGTLVFGIVIMLPIWGISVWLMKRE